MSAMGGCRRKQASAVVRVMPPGVTGLEIWDCRVREAVLWDFREQACFARVLAEVLHAIGEGRARSRSQGAIDARAMGFEALFLAGGGLSPPLAEHLHCLGVPVISAPDPVFAGAPGGRSLLAVRGLNGPLVDVGQSSVKLMYGERRLRLERDWARLPMRETVAFADYPAQALELRNFIARGIVRIVEDADIDGLVLALPCTIDAKARLGGSSYAAMRDNADLVGATVRAAGLEGVSVLLLNDAELAACSARLCADLEPYKKTLVVTLGFGIGAALLET